MEKQGQGALEYLLLIGGGLIVTAVTLVFVISVNEGSSDVVHSGDNTVRDLVICGLDGCGTQYVVNATITGSRYASYWGCNESTTFCTITDYSSNNNDYGGVLRFTIPSAIPSSAVIDSAKLRLYDYYASGTCTKTDPLYFYNNSAYTCQTTYNSTPDSGPPAGYVTSVHPVPNNCTIGWKEFEIKNAIEKDKTTLVIEIRGNDIAGVSTNYRCWYSNNSSYEPTLEITYTA